MELGKLIKVCHNKSCKTQKPETNIHHITTTMISAVNKFKNKKKIKNNSTKWQSNTKQSENSSKKTKK